MNVEEIEEEYKTSIKTGLSTEEAKKRLKIYGYNEIPEKRFIQLLNFSLTSGILLLG